MGRTEAGATVAECIRGADRIFLAAHENPDGDAVGSILALRSMLLSRGNTVHTGLPDPPPERFDFLEGFSSITTTPPPWHADLAIVLDCDGADRLGDLREAVMAADTVVDIDHHRGLNPFGDIQLIDPNAPATAALVVEVARCLDLLPPTPGQATALYAALIADTGCFRFTNTTPEALRLGADLVAAGADPAEIARRVFSLRPLSSVMLQARALGSLHGGDGVLLATLGQQDFVEIGASPGETEGIIDTFRDVPGVRAAALLKETEPGVWQVSMRGNGVDVASVAMQFGGGGHKFAAGFTVEGHRDEVTERLLEALKSTVEAQIDA